MDEIQTRLQDTSQNCLKAYAEWVNNKKDSKVQETLHSAIHELRKVSSRLEIELAVNERDQMASRPLPIPSHRANKVKHGGDGDGEMSNGENNNPRPIKKSSVAAGMKKRRTPSNKDEPETGNEAG